MLQEYDAAAGEQSLDLSPMLLRAGGLFGGLYRSLLNDKDAVIPDALVAADERAQASTDRV